MFRMNNKITFIRLKSNDNSIFNKYSYEDYLKNVSCDKVLLKAEKNSEQDVAALPTAMIYFKFTIRSSEKSRKINSYDRIRDERTGEVFEITWCEETTNKRYIEIQAKKADDQSIYKQ